MSGGVGGGAARSRSPPPKNCPICGERIWSTDEGAFFDPPRWVRYNNHLDSTHPAFANWNRKTYLGYFAAFLTWVPCFGLAIWATQVSSPDPAKIFAGLAFPAALSVMIIVWKVRQRGTRRFHELWNKERGAPTKLA